MKISVYLRDRLHVIILALLSAAAVLLVALLGHESMELAFYAVELIGAFSLIYLAYDFWRYRARLKRLRAAAERPSLMQKELPAPKTGIEQGYRTILDGLYREIEKALSEKERESRNDEEYYTLWVHQIKTPIAALRLIAGELENREAKADILTELFSIERYTDLALQYTRIRDISGDIVIERFDAEKAVKKCVKKFAPQFIRMKTSLSIGMLPDDILSDEKWFSFMLEQIISNAVKYTKGGEVCIEGKERILTVKDTGIGIRAEDLPRIFEKGYTGFNGRIDNRASGIGLYLTEKVAKALAVKITVESEPGKGTRIMLVFPDAVVTD